MEFYYIRENIDKKKILKLIRKLSQEEGKMILFNKETMDKRYIKSCQYYYKKFGHRVLPRNAVPTIEGIVYKYYSTNITINNLLFTNDYRWKMGSQLIYNVTDNEEPMNDEFLSWISNTGISVEIRSIDEIIK